MSAARQGTGKAAGKKGAPPALAEMARARVVPVSGHTAGLVWAASAAMAFLAVLALALGLAAGRLADDWGAGLDGTATLRLPAAPGQLAAVTARAETLLAESPGILRSRTLSPSEQRALLEPWFGPDLPVEALPLPGMIELGTGPGFDPQALRDRLTAEIPDAVLDDHTRWRQPLVRAAGGLRVVALAGAVLIAVAMAAMVTLAAGFSLAANAQVLRVLRLIGAPDSFVARAFTRRFALRALIGAAGGTALGMAALAAIPRGAGLFQGIGPQGLDWLAMLAIPPAAALIAWIATRRAALRVLKTEG